MKLFNAEQIRRWDAFTIQYEPIASIDLMERAAAACYNWIKENVFSISERHFKIFCAKGNNGGDGLVIARMLLNDGYKVTVHILEYGNIGTDDFQINLQRLHAITTDIDFIQSAEFFPAIKKEDIIIDAIFGTGLNKPIEGFTASLIEHINRSASTVISIDIPTGMFADKTCKDLLTIKANYTLSFQTYKMCFLMAENETAVGELYILDIGLLKEYEAQEPTPYTLIEKNNIQQIYRPRKKFAHKGNFGHALILAGSYGKMGAAVLSAKACLRSGVGLLTMHVPEVGYEIIQVSVPEAMATIDEIMKYELYDSIGIGPGLSTSEAAKKILTVALKHSHGKRLILDADALNILSADNELLSKLPAHSILTPHPKEFERLFGKCDNDFARIDKALKKAKQLNCFIILKGHNSFIASPDGTGYFNSTGNAGMAKGGSGDILTGMLTGLSAQEYSILETCIFGTYLHGLAGDIAAENFSQEAMIAQDIIESIASAFKLL